MQAFAIFIQILHETSASDPGKELQQRIN